LKKETQMQKRKNESNSLKFRQTGSHMPLEQSNRSSCLLGSIIRLNLLKKDPQKLSVSRIESFMN